MNSISPVCLVTPVFPQQVSAFLRANQWPTTGSRKQRGDASASSQTAAVQNRRWRIEGIGSYWSCKMCWVQETGKQFVCRWRRTITQSLNSSTCSWSWRRASAPTRLGPGSTPSRIPSHGEQTENGTLGVGLCGGILTGSVTASGPCRGSTSSSPVFYSGGCCSTPAPRSYPAPSAAVGPEENHS